MRYTTIFHKTMAIHNSSASIIKITDEKVRNTKSEFLSSSGLPNILQPRILNSSAARMHGFNSTISKDDMAEICSKLIASGYIEKDIELLSRHDASRLPKKARILLLLIVWFIHTRWLSQKI